jgi:hypothetical protein
MEYAPLKISDSILSGIQKKNHFQHVCFFKKFILLFVQSFHRRLTVTNFYRKTCEIHKVSSLIQPNFCHAQESRIKSMDTCLETSHIPFFFGK